MTTNNNSNNNSKDIPSISKYPSQAVLTQSYGFNKYELADKLRNYMHIEDKYLEALKRYRMVHMTGATLKLAIVDGMIKNLQKPNDPRYSVIYHNCSPYYATRAEEVRVSFRMAVEEFNLEPIVLVEIVAGGLLKNNWKRGQ